MTDNGGDIVVRGGGPDSQIEMSANAFKEIGETGAISLSFETNS